MDKAILQVHLACTFAMVGIIWFVQVVHYPLFDRVDAKGFVAFERDHQRLTTWVVAPPMLGELATAVLLLFLRPPNVEPWQPWVGLFALAVIWLSTIFVQVPDHQALSAGFDPQAHRHLVLGNWLRTWAWTGRGLLVLWMAYRATE